MSDNDPSGDPAEPAADTWHRLYALVLFELGITVVALYALARWASS